MIEAFGLHKRYGPVEVLRGLSLSIAPGRVTALVGPNGAGKTTFIKSVLGLVRPDDGVLCFDGKEIGDDPRYRARIGYMPQIARFPDNLTGLELLALLRDLRGDRPTDERLIDEFALREQLNKKLRVLSGGTRQKVNAVAAFLLQPELLILDEPTAGLDPVASGLLKDRIRAERVAGNTVILTSHIMSEIDELADDVVYLTDGRVEWSGSLASLKGDTGHQLLECAIAELMIRKVAA